MIIYSKLASQLRSKIGKNHRKPIPKILLLSRPEYRPVRESGTVIKQECRNNKEYVRGIRFEQARITK